MEIITYKVPKGISKLSDWKEFKDIIPSGKCILNKKVTGCGATTYFLDENNPTPVILCSHRLELLKCKAEAPRHVGKVFLFKTEEDTSKEDLINNLNRLRTYLTNCYSVYPPELGIKPLPPKILVTTDSLHHVIEVLKEFGILEDFTLVSDEMQCIFTDASFKGTSVMNYLNNVQDIKNVIYLSATPYLSHYLDQINEFKDLPYIELEFDNSVVDDIWVSEFYVTSLIKAITEKIKFFKANGYFEENYLNQKATQAVFFLNSVTDIIRVLEKLELKPEECNIICSKTSKTNEKRLSKIGFSIGSAQKEGEEHATYTFVTKCAFEGVDFYHPNAYTYVFSDPNLNNLSVDLSIDLLQILGRQRLMTNPWKAKATIYYLTTKESSKITVEDFQKYLKQKIDNTNETVNGINNASTEERRKYLIELHRRANEKKPFDLDYVSLVNDSETGRQVAVLNSLVRLSEIRAWDIKNNTYGDKYQVVSDIEKTGINISNKDYVEFEKEIDSLPDFISKMRKYCEFARDHDINYLYQSIKIPRKFHEYYEILGPDRIRALSYQESKIKDELLNDSSQDAIKSAVYLKFSGIKKITKPDAKKMLQEVYDELGLNKVAKSTELSEYYSLVPTSLVIDGKRLKGFYLEMKN